MINRGISADLQITINSIRVFPRERLRRGDSRVYIYRVYTWRGHTPAAACVGYWIDAEDELSIVRAQILDS